MRRFAKVTLLIVALLVVGAGCDDGRSASPSQAMAQDPGVVHVHGLGINPRDGALFAATHTGLFIVGDGTATRVTEPAGHHGLHRGRPRPLPGQRPP